MTLAVPPELCGPCAGLNDDEVFARERALERFFSAHYRAFTRFPDYFRLRTYEFRVVRHLCRADFTPLNPFERVVEIGCGFGYRLLTLAPFARTLVGIDVPEPYHAFPDPQGRPAVDIARDLVAGRFGQTQCSFAAAYPSRLPLPDASCDLLYSEYTLEHIPDIDGFVHEAWRVLEPGGVMCHVVPVTADHLLAFAEANARIGLRTLGSIVKGWLLTLAGRGGRQYGMSWNATIIPPCHSEFARSFTEQLHIYRLERYLLPMLDEGFVLDRIAPVREHSCLLLLRKRPIAGSGGRTVVSHGE